MRLGMWRFFVCLHRYPLWYPFPPLHGRGDGVRDLPRLTHHDEQRVWVRLLVDLEQRVYVVPAARGGDVLQRKMLSLRRPLSPIRVPEAAMQLRKLGVLLCDGQPLVEQVAIHRRVRVLLRREDPAANGAKAALKRSNLV